MNKNEIPTDFKTVNLDQIREAGLFDRIDTKYNIGKQELPVFLNKLKNDYYALQIGGNIVLPYSTTYFDTEDYGFYTDHHNGKLNRSKIRRRRYHATDTNFLEVKIKNNKGRTRKLRIQTENQNGTVSDEERIFLNENAGLNDCRLLPTLQNSFDRITLVGKNFIERCTIDFNINFKCGKARESFSEIAVIEIKTVGRPSESPAAKLLRDMRVKPTGFSKYCLGMAELNMDIKKNGFKRKLRELSRYGD